MSIINKENPMTPMEWESYFDWHIREKGENNFKKFDSLESYINQAWLDTKAVYNLGEIPEQVEQKFKEAFLSQVKIDFERKKHMIEWANGEGMEEEIRKQIDWLNQGATNLSETEQKDLLAQYKDLDSVIIFYTSDSNDLSSNLRAGVIAAGIAGDGQLPYKEHPMFTDVTEGRRPVFSTEIISLPLNYEFTDELETSKQR